MRIDKLLYKYLLNVISAIGNVISAISHLGNTKTINSRGLRFKISCNNWITKYRARTFNDKEPEMLDWMDENLLDEDVFFDVGANVGTYTIPAAKVVNRVIAIELDPANLYCLHTNIFINELQGNVLIIPIASGSSKDVQDIFYRDFSIGDGTRNYSLVSYLSSSYEA